MSWIDGRVAVVTGASRGIGRAAVMKLAEAGAIVVAASRSEGPLDELQREIESAGLTGAVVACDVTDPAAVDRVFETARQFGDPTILVCCAGWTHKAAVDEINPADFRRTVEINLTGTFLCCRGAWEPMKRSGGGRIITFSSLSGVYATDKFPGLAAYN
ncbi:MAG: SDR family NAD(P)-dependent oxidoreductase, partial [Actinomycetota bacterium]